MGKLPDVQLTIRSQPHSTGKAIAESVQLGHGSLLLRIIDRNGKEQRLVVYDVDGPDRPEYDYWRKQ